MLEIQLWFNKAAQEKNPKFIWREKKDFCEKKMYLFGEIIFKNWKQTVVSNYKCEAMGNTGR